MNTIINEIVDKEYKHGFVSNIDSEILDKGLNVKTIQEISKKKMNQIGSLTLDLKHLKNG